MKPYSWFILAILCSLIVVGCTGIVTYDSGQTHGYARGLKEGREAPIEALAEEAADKAYEGLSKRLVRVFEDLNKAESQVLIHVEIAKRLRAERQALEKTLLDGTSGATRNQVKKLLDTVPRS